MRFLFLFLIFSPFLAFGETLYYYYEGKKVELSEDFSSYTFIKHAAVKTTFEIPSAVRIRQSKMGIFILEDVDAATKPLLAKNGVLFPAYRRADGTRVNISGNIYVQLPELSDDEAKRWCEKHGLNFIKKYKYTDGWVLASTGAENPVKMSAEIVEKGWAENAEPSFFLPLRLRSYTPNDTLFPKQWHLQNSGVSSLTGSDHAHVAEAWEMLKVFKGDIGGTGIKIAIPDDGFDLSHEDLNGQFLSGYDFCGNDSNPSYVASHQDEHGTACAGVAAAKADNGKGVAGACPNCKIIPIRLDFYNDDLDSMGIDAFEFAADNGADIISNSWGPEDKGGSYPMGSTLKNMIARLTSSEGRNGKGIIITFAAGNGNESIETDGFASNANVFAIGATRADGKRCIYSDFGTSLDFMAPSSDYTQNYSKQYDGIWTTDNSGKDGYNSGKSSQGDSKGNYTNDFSGTSSACPLAAGIAGLVLYANPDLTRDQVYDIFKDTSDRVGGVEYTNNFNNYYGYGRLNACEAVKRALKMAGRNVSQANCGGTIVDPGDSGDSGDTSDTGDSGDSGDTSDSGDTDGCTGISVSGIALSEERDNILETTDVTGAIFKDGESGEVSIGFYTDGDWRALGTYDLGSDINKNYKTCTQCLRLYHINSAGNGVIADYFQESGTLKIVKVDEDLNTNGVFSAKLVEVTIANDYTSTPVAGGSCVRIEGGFWKFIEGEDPVDTGDSGDSSDSGDSGDSGDSSSDSGDSASDSGDSASDTGDSTSDTGDTTPDTGDSASDTGDSASDTGDSMSDTGDPATDTGDSSDSGDSGDSSSDSGAPATDNDSDAGTDDSPADHSGIKKASSGCSAALI